MAEVTLEEVTSALENTSVSPSGVSFEGKSLKLNSEDDAKEVVEAIERCKNLEYLNLEGNTLGVDAAKSIAKALEKHPELKRALWKDLFTGRMKTEIPKALEFLGNGLVASGARLRELDLSDNAFGPIGVQGLAALLRSSSCYALEELRLNNNGLGITGGKLLASALMECYRASKAEGNPLALKVFIAGRNRLENEGAQALAEVFKAIGTLEEVAMPQNGIYHVGISALSDAFTHNKNLEIINLNDNTIGPKGSQAISDALPNLQNLKELNFGDCLLKTKGAKLLAAGLRDGHEKLEVLILGFNEINAKGGADVVDAVANKGNLKSLVLGGNQFGGDGRMSVRNKLKEYGKLNTLGSLSDDESEDSDADEGDEIADQSTNSDTDNEINSKTEFSDTKTDFSETKTTVENFRTNPDVKTFLALGENRSDLLLKEATKTPASYLENFIPILMNVAALSVSTDKSAVEAALTCSELLYRELFTWAQKSDKLSILNNSLLVNLGLIKSEDKKFKPPWNLEGCLATLESVIKKNYIPQDTRDALKVFMEREIAKNGQFLETKRSLLNVLK